ncbi:YafY family transcriptional regulator [Stenotrophomonas maltophilia]|uniref:helix-turn-helix transcriptional regulator n=2 Tax=Stenotrophomonas maltophilia TaxID=40324 RepID=UPI000C26633B|nr:YafY family protein [Stenotrophomonas maltophilia]MBA0395840.1 YafY family transcriptional regulator [Stenotrophomonas maltophilia]MBN5143297.1 YafY family transcriptional regulator [Stenotrophomonas maltophilia]PJK95984.1 DNA-binding transcriptional regulator [Stenotrophomonas maltophilia]PJL45414.1 DNA-binding transcriptional regulator [Stenotrophomonas maltophilia]QGL78315.1 YafY family transcriptional regulator [Stenotrophomonas maltophilia]
MRKADRLFQLVNLIRVRQPVTAAVLAAELGLSVRSIYRYIDDLSVAGIPVYGETGIGYRLDPGFELPPLSLDAAEAEALQLAVEMLACSGAGHLQPAARSLLHKLQAAMPERAASPRTARALRAVPVSLPYWQPLHIAIAAGRSVHLRYRTLQGAPSDRIVYPLGLFHWGQHWTLGSWCGLRQDYRDFRLDQIEALAEADGLALPAQVGLEAYLRHQQRAWTLRGH